MKMRLFGLIGVAALAAAPAFAQSIENVRGEKTEAIIATEEQRELWYNGAYHFAPAHRAGDYLFFSGVVASAPDDEPLDDEGFKRSVRAAFDTIGVTLEKAGVGFDAVVKMNTYHVFGSQYVALEKRDQIFAFLAVKDEYVTEEPWPAWTAVGVPELFPGRGLVEIELVAYAPQEE